MDVIALEGMKFLAGHGFYEEEAVLRGEFILDLEVAVDVSGAVEEDDLFKTVNYETLFYLCKQEMEKPAKLLETVAHRIVDRIDEQFEGIIKGMRLKLKKMNPPLDGQVASASVEVKVDNFERSSKVDWDLDRWHFFYNAGYLGLGV